MNNKILEFVREFNSGLENSNEYNYLRYSVDGFTEALVLSDMYFWTDDSSSEFVKQMTLSSLLKQIYDLQEVAEPMMAEEIDKFFAEKRKNAEKKFTYARFKYARIAKLRWKLEVSGTYNEDIMEQFLDVVKEDFQYIFQGCSLDIEYDGNE